MAGNVWQWAHTTWRAREMAIGLSAGTWGIPRGLWKMECIGFQTCREALHVRIRNALVSVR